MRKKKKKKKKKLRMLDDFVFRKEGRGEKRRKKLYTCGLRALW
jgi:hypothetical protein